MKTPKECKTLEELIEVEIDLRARLIIEMAKFQGYLGVTQRTVEVLSNNPTEELLQEMQKQMADLNFAWTIKEGEIRNFLENMKTITEVRKELTPKYQPIFIPTTGMPGMGGLNPLQ